MQRTAFSRRPFKAFPSNCSLAPPPTALFCGIAATLDVIIATAIAYIMLRTKVPGRNALDFTVTNALAIPGVVLGIGYLRTFKGIEIPFTDELLTSSWV